MVAVLCGLAGAGCARNAAEVTPAPVSLPTHELAVRVNGGGAVVAPAIEESCAGECVFTHFEPIVVRIVPRPGWELVETSIDCKVDESCAVGAARSLSVRFARVLGVYEWTVKDGVGPDAMAVRGDGGIVAAGSFFHSVAFGDQMLSAPDNSRDGFVAEYDADGRLIAARDLGEIGQDEVYAVEVLTTTSVAAGSLSGPIDFGSGPAPIAQYGAGRTDGFIAMWSAAGEVRWVHVFGHRGMCSAHGLTASSVGVVAIGSARSPFELDGTTVGTDSFVASFSAEGSVQWVVEVNPSDGCGRDECWFALMDIVADPLVDTVFVAGRVRGDVAMSGRALAFDGDDALAIVALDPRDGSVANAFLFPLTGRFASIKNIDVKADYIAVSATFEGDLQLGGDVVAPQSQSQIVFVIDRDTGALSWSRVLDPAGRAMGGDVLLSDDGGVVVVSNGYKAGTDAPANVTWFSATGEVEAQHDYAGTITSIARAEDGGLLLGGSIGVDGAWARIVKLYP